jgi:molybdopterin/thiamine biosynthesis adenylyltransferase
MPGKFHHETLYRGGELLAKLSACQVTICGVGAVGSNLADNLARQGMTKLRAIDHDRVEEHNVSTQLYGENEIGAWKVEALRNRLFRSAGIEIDAMRKEVTAANARSLLKDANLIVDALDNADARRNVQGAARLAGISCLHVGLYEDYFEVVWDETYRVPPNAGGDVCDYPLARNLILLAVAVASEVILEFLGNGTRASWSGTLKDFQILGRSEPL